MRDRVTAFPIAHQRVHHQMRPRTRKESSQSGEPGAGAGPPPFNVSDEEANVNVHTVPRPDPDDSPTLQDPNGQFPQSGGCGSGLDPSVPHPARVYAYWLGGKDYYPADRRAAEEVLSRRPQVVATARANRAFLARVVGFLAAECGIRQFLDIGTGLPAPDGTHEVAQEVAPHCRVVYVDNDPVVMAHARALLTSTAEGVCDYVEADLRDTGTVLAQAARTLDLTQPVAVLLLAVLHLVPDRDDPAKIVKTLASALAPGSYVAISHLTADFAPREVAAAVEAYNALAPVPVTARTHPQVTALLGGHPLVAPGVVKVTEWRPGTTSHSRAPADLYAGLARITRAHP
jgi:SAM-dependent methyltransferase